MEAGWGQRDAAPIPKILSLEAIYFRFWPPMDNREAKSGSFYEDYADREELPHYGLAPTGI